MREFLHVYTYVAQFKKKMYAAVAYITISILLGIVPYYLIYLIIMRFMQDEPLSLAYLGIVAGLILGSLLLRTQTLHKGMSASHKLAYDTLMGMRTRLADKLRKMPMGAVSRHSTGSLKKNFVENIEDMELMLAHAVPEGISNLLMLTVISVTMFALDWRMALLALAVLPIGLLAVVLMVKDGMKRMGPYYQASQEMNDNIIEYVAGMEVIKVFNQTTSSFQKYRTSVENYRKFALDWYQVSWNYMTVYSIVLPSTLLFLLPGGAWFYTNGTLSLGAFVMAILLAMSMGAPLIRLVEFLPILPTLRQKAQKIERLFEEPELAKGAIRSAPKDYTVEFRHVTFAYGDLDVIRDVSFTAKENAVTALVGESGAGKSTLAKLLVRFWDVNEGAVAIGGVDIREMSMETLMKTISYVSQDVFLFNTTIMENIRMGRQDAADDEVVAMAKLAQCHDFIMETERGYQTVVGDAGDKLSGGQRQRLSIARAMLKNAPVVVLDEATSATDPENEDRIQAALNGLIQGKTLIVIAHRLSTVADADNLVLMDRGRIAAQGTHADLLAASPIYRTMWQAHMESMDWDLNVKERSR
ncbi:ABC transporter ATP-binding protein [Cohnella sp.]|uniref:ABC transporter ATP-binding protein n=1 Tax=Cohnella sp. TaxID=1883426 RepID=UPI0035685222